MNAVRIHKFGGGPQDLVYEEDVMQPHPKEGEVLMHTKWVTQMVADEIRERIWVSG